jgi:hypothetical protein
MEKYLIEIPVASVRKVPLLFKYIGVTKVKLAEASDSN